MTLTIRVLGVELLHIALDDELAEDTEPGDFSSTAIGFTATLDVPDEAQLTSRGWDDKR